MFFFLLKINLQIISCIQINSLLLHQHPSQSLSYILSLNATYRIVICQKWTNTTSRRLMLQKSNDNDDDKTESLGRDGADSE